MFTFRLDLIKKIGGGIISEAQIQFLDTSFCQSYQFHCLHYLHLIVLRWNSTGSRKEFGSSGSYNVSSKDLEVVRVRLVVGMLE